jgi:ribonucleoside-diphosphate reductase alpha chain
MLMRVSVGIHLDDLESVLETYDLMSKKFFTHATPTLFNAGTPKPQMSSCFLWLCKMIVLTDIRHVETNGKKSQSAGGVGLTVQNYIRNKWNIKWYCSESIQ